MSTTKATCPACFASWELPPSAKPAPRLSCPVCYYEFDARPRQPPPAAATNHSRHLDTVLDNLRVRFEQGERPTVEEYLSRHPEWANNEEAVMDLLYNEILLRKRHGQAFDLDEYLRRFPHLAEQIRMQFEVDDMLLDGESGELDFGHPTGDYHPGGDEPPPMPDIPGCEYIGALGRGGMGVVYRARQTGLGRIVAVKLLLSGSYASEAERQRFLHEAQVLAGLRHPGIVQIFEIGQTREGTYLILEFVDGGSLADRLDGTPWPAAHAAQMVERVARAVQAAHDAGVVHRDLKPGNILLSTSADSTIIQKAAVPARSAGVHGMLPKITDFGIAKRLDAEGGMTASGDVVGTPAYMSPEQAAGKVREIGPASDVYALGAILYELLTGRPPFVSQSPIDTILQVLKNEPVVPKKLNPSVPLDLDTICLKCLEKEPAKRYASAVDLADDLRRFQSDEPIRARPVSLPTKIRKWARRNPSRAILYGSLFLALIGGIMGGVWHTLRVRAERDRAEHNADLAGQAVDEMLTEVAEEHLALEPRMEEKRRVLLEKALAFYERLQAANEGNPKLRRQSSLAQKRLGDILRLLGRNGDAERAYALAIDRLRPIAAASPNDYDVRRALADSHNFLGEVLRTSGRLDDAREQYVAAQQIQEDLALRTHSREPKTDLARTRYNLGLLYKEKGELEPAARELRESGEQLRQLLADDPQNPVYIQHLARALFNLGTVRRLEGNLGDAIAVTQESNVLLDGLRKRFPSYPDYRHELAVSRNNLGNYYSRDKRPAEADAEQAAATDLFRGLARDFPRIPVYRREQANCLNSLGATRAGQRDFANARTAWEEAAGLLEVIVGESEGDSSVHGVYGTVLGNLGKLHLLTKDYDAARASLLKGMTQLAVALGPNPRQPDYLAGYRNQVKDLADVTVRSGGNVGETATAIDPEGTTFTRRMTLVFLARCLSQANALPEGAGRSALINSVQLEATSRLTDIPPGDREATDGDADLRPLLQLLATP